jgi:hypothetical protein
LQFVNSNLEKVKMKYLRKSLVFTIVLMLSAMLMTTALAFPISDVTMNVVDGTSSYFLTTLSGIPAGEDISDGTYPGWCVDTSTPIPRDEDLVVTLYSSLAPPASLSGEAWDMVNYILNNKKGGRIDIQAAIWYFIKLDAGYVTPGYYTYNPGGNPYGGDPPSADTEAMVADAIANGTGYTPGPSDILAVICVPETPVQISIVELELPPEGEGLSPGFWKHNIKVALGLSRGSFSSPHEGEPHITEAELLALAAKIPVTLEDALTALQAKGPGSATIRLDMANAFNMAAGYGEYMDMD